MLLSTGSELCAAYLSSARPIRIASARIIVDSVVVFPLPQHISCGLHPGFSSISAQKEAFASARPIRIASPPYSTSSAWLACFASARPMRIASRPRKRISLVYSTLPQHVPCGLHPALDAVGLAQRPLPQHVPCGLHPWLAMRCAA